MDTANVAGVVGDEPAVNSAIVDKMCKDPLARHILRLQCACHATARVQAHVILGAPKSRYAMSPQGSMVHKCVCGVVAATRGKVRKHRMQEAGVNVSQLSVCITRWNLGVDVGARLPKVH